MGGVDQGDQLQGYYRCRSKSRKFYKHIFYFFLDVAITNAYILMKNCNSSCPFKDFKSFRLQLAKDLIGKYCSCRHRGRGGTVVHPLPFRHYPIRLDADNDGPRHPRGPCAHHRNVHHRRVLSSWYCRVGSGCATVESHQVTASCSGIHAYMSNLLLHCYYTLI